ncbi:hypothetical protein ACSBR2_025955 [Camellia fascicularis]
MLFLITQLQISLQLFVFDRFTKDLPNLVAVIRLQEGNRSWDLMSGASTSGGIRTAFSYCVQQIRNYDYHPQALSSVIYEHKINKGWLTRSIEARINDAKREVIEIPETIEELGRYAEDTVSTILYMTLQAGGFKSTAADHAASHIGKASGLLLLLKSLPYHASRSCQVSYIPAKVAAKHGLLVNQGSQMEICMDSHESLCENGNTFQNLRKTATRLSQRNASHDGFISFCLLALYLVSSSQSKLNGVIGPVGFNTGPVLIIRIVNV